MINSVYQQDLTGNPTLSKQEINARCSSVCYFATEKQCVCHCGGVYHGNGHKPQYGARSDITALTPDQAEPFIKEMKDNGFLECAYCGTDLTGLPLYAYPHGAGWTVKDLDAKQWLYIHCPKCGYDWAVWKLGVKRE